MIKDAVKLNFLTKEFTKLTEDAIQPMSIKDIQEKFKLSFPFKVKRVRNSSGLASNAFPVGHEFVITNIWNKPCEKKGMEFVTNNKGKINHQSAELQDYMLSE